MGPGINTDGAAELRASAGTEAPRIPRILILPPLRGSASVDPLEMILARSLVHDLSLTLCKSRLYEVVAPYTAGQIAGGVSSGLEVHADYRVRTEIAPKPEGEFYPVLAVEVTVAGKGDVIFSDRIMLRSGVLLELHYGLCAMLTDRICGEIARRELMQYRRTGAASAYVHYLLAMQFGDRTDLPAALRAQKSLQRSISLSPDYVPALSQMARMITVEWLERATEDRTLLIEARHLAARANLYDPQDSASMREIGRASLYLHDLDTALASYAAAERYAPNHADLLADQADVLTHASRADEAEGKIQRALALNPLAPDYYYWIGGAVSFFRGRYSEALERLTTMQSPGLASRLMAACAAMNNDPESAARYRQMALERDPTFVIEKWKSLYPQPSKADTQHYLSALRLAGFS